MNDKTRNAIDALSDALQKEIADTHKMYHANAEETRKKIAAQAAEIAELRASVKQLTRQLFEKGVETGKQVISEQVNRKTE